MPTPIGHSLFGILFYRGFVKKWQWKPATIFFVILISVLPDFDFIPGMVIGFPNCFHHSIAHSFGFALILAVLIYLVEMYFRKSKRPYFAGWFFFLYSLHLCMDYFCLDTRAPFGQPLFWPLNNTYFAFPHPIFMDVQRSPVFKDFFTSLLSWHNGKAVLLEIGITVLLFLMIEIVKRIARVVRVSRNSG